MPALLTGLSIQDLQDRAHLGRQIGPAFLADGLGDAEQGFGHSDGTDGVVRIESLSPP